MPRYYLRVSISISESVPGSSIWTGPDPPLNWPLYAWLNLVRDRALLGGCLSTKVRKLGVILGFEVFGWRGNTAGKCILPKRHLIFSYFKMHPYNPIIWIKNKRVSLYFNHRSESYFFFLKRCRNYINILQYYYIIWSPI